MIFDWPANLIPENPRIKPPRQTAGISTSLTNLTQRVPVIRPPFTMQLDFGNLFGDEVLAWRAMEGLFEGRANICRVPLFDLWFQPDEVQIRAGAVTHSDGTSFSDGARYLTGDLSGVTVTALQGDRMISVDFGDYGQILQGGLYFGIGERPYLATGVWWNGNVATIRTSPTMRHNYAGEAVKLRPTMLVGLVDDDAADLALVRARYGTAVLDLVERFDEPLS